MRRTAIFALVLLALTTLVSACGSTQTAPATKPKSDAATTTPDPKPSGPKQQLAIGATASTSSVYVYWVTLGKVINDKVLSVNTTVVETGASIDNLKRLGKGDIDFGLVSNDVGFQQFSGLEPFKGQANPKLRALWIYEEIPTNVVVTQSSGIKALKDLTGKQFNPGFSGSSTESLIKQAFAALDIAPKWFLGSNQDAVDAVKDRRSIGLAKSGWSDASIKDIQSTIPINILTYTPEDEAKVKAKVPGIVWLTVPADMYKGVPTYRTWGNASTATATTDMSVDLAYALTKAAVENTEEIAKAYPSVKGNNLIELTLKDASYPLHAGTIKYFKEKGANIPANLIPPEAK